MPLKFYENITDSAISFFRATKFIEIKAIVLKNEQLQAVYFESNVNLDYYLENGFKEIPYERYLKNVACWKRTLKLQKQIRNNKEEFNKLCKKD